jgi:hypothetical protein
MTVLGGRVSAEDLHRYGAMAGEQKLECFHGINWRRIEKSLDHFTFEVFELVDFVLSFGAFGDNFES